MANRTGTYIAFDGNGTTNPTESSMKYYGLLQKWNDSDKYELNFTDSHKKTSQVKDTSSPETLKSRLLERMRKSKNMLLIISPETSYDRGMLNFEIEKAIDYYGLPIIIAYTNYNYILTPSSHEDEWPKALKERINNKSAKCIHVSFKQKAIAATVTRYSIHSKKEDQLTSSLHYIKESLYKTWGYKD